MDSPRIISLILGSLEEMNLQLPPERRIPISPGTPLFGSGGWLDSLGMVNLIVLVEERIYNEFRVEIILSDAQTSSEQDSPFRNVETLADYISRLIERSEKGGTDAG